MNDSTVKHLSTLHRVLYRATGGVIGRRLVDNDMGLLTTRGRHSGRSHTVPLLYLEEADRFVVIASYGGRPRHPDWYHNLLADPSAWLQVPGRRLPVTARTANADERAAWWPRIVDAYAGYAAYQQRTEREIPVVFLDSRNSRRPADVGCTCGC